MPIYICKLCDFKSPNKKNYNNHLKTQKHQKKVQESLNETLEEPKRNIKKRDYKCNYCGNNYSTSGSLARHKRTCVEVKSKDIEMEALKKENERLQREAIEEKKRLQKEAKEKEEIFRKQLESYEQLLKSMTTPQTINYFNYIVQNYPNAPALEGQECYKNLLESKVSSLVDIITMYHYDNKLVNFIGDYLIKTYTHKEPKNQSIWSTDISRLTYIISESNKTEKTVNNWTYDKKGSKTKKLIIEPVLQYIRDELYDYCQENGSSTKASKLKKLIASNEIIQTIDNGELLDKINKYIAPEFSFKQTDKKILVN